jgi:prolyl-tRNA editing enzyme YbaK/EbsC (Cys-tRNA(Pro) deacylase)
MSRHLGVENVRQHIESLGLEVLELPDDTATAESAARALQTAVGSIVKSLLFFVGDTPVLVLAAGNHQVDPVRIADELGGGSARLARPREVQEVSGYTVGGVPPVAHRQSLSTLMDTSLVEHSVVYAAAGSKNAVFAIAPLHLAEITRARMLAVEQSSSD